MAFNLELSPTSREHLKNTRDELIELYSLPDNELADRLLAMCRELRATYPQHLSDPNTFVYDPNFVWHVVPEIAKRLGATDLLPNEASDRRITGRSNVELREREGQYLKFVSIHRWGEHLSLKSPKPSAADILCHDIPNGNPVAFAIDRLCAPPEPGLDKNDWIACHMREISAIRGFEPTPYWSPELQSSAHRQKEDAAQSYEEQYSGPGYQ